MNTRLTETPTHFRNGVTGQKTEDGAYAVACGACGWAKELPGHYNALQDARAHMCPRKVRS